METATTCPCEEDKFCKKVRIGRYGIIGDVVRGCPHYTSRRDSSRLFVSASNLSGHVNSIVFKSSRGVETKSDSVKERLGISLSYDVSNPDYLLVVTVKGRRSKKCTCPQCAN